MSPFGASKCSEGDEESFDLCYLEIEQRIMLLISEEEEEVESIEKTERESLWYRNSYNFNQGEVLNAFTEKHISGYYGSGDWNEGKKIEEFVDQWSYGSAGCKRSMSNYQITGRRGTGVFIPKSTAY